MVTGVGAENFIYQWNHNKTVIFGEIEDTLIITNLTLGDSGVYMCTVVNQYGHNDSSSALLIVTGMHMHINDLI